MSAVHRHLLGRIFNGRVKSAPTFGKKLYELLFGLFLRAFHSLNEAVGKLLSKILSAFIVLFRN